MSKVLSKDFIIQKVNFRDRFSPHIEELKKLNIDEEQNFDDILSQYYSIQSASDGKISKGKVIKKTKSHLLISVDHLKNEFSIPVNEFQLDKTKSVPEVGDEVDVYVDDDAISGKAVLSREKAIREEAWKPIEESYSKGETVKGMIFGQIKGGLTVDLSGIVAFLPGSQIDTSPVQPQDLEKIMNTVQDFFVIKMDKSLGNIIVSRRKVLESRKEVDKFELYKKISIGTKLRGRVKNITDYGAFIDLVSTDGLVHITDISWKRINHPSEELTIGQFVDVVVIDIIELGENNKRIALGIKQLDDNPWQEIKNEFPVGKVIDTKITNITDYGVFVELKSNIDGLIHTSQLRWSRVTPQDISNLYRVGQEIRCVVVNIDDAKYRVSLSAKQCIKKPWDNFINENPIGSVISKPIKSIQSFGVFVDLAPDLVGLLHESDMPTKDRGAYIVQKYKNQKEIECKIIGVDEQKGRLILSTKNLSDDSSTDTGSTTNTESDEEGSNNTDN